MQRAEHAGVVRVREVHVVLRGVLLRVVSVVHRVLGGEAEVTHEQAVVGAQQEVLRLKVLVRDALAVAVIDGGDELLEVVPRLVLAEVPARDDEVEQLPALRELHDEVEGDGGVEELVELHDVRMFE
ncbi:hypothetical protein STCU_11699 [Strigomonas culicis]|uniref:Uncharacterized protein n=1 Tax=Strigomonas culicis TaxID=28005 RepID=S9UZ95_9TRYP|nr:hypothetical protein STCU_11699 [Strigomonas culicis]|eukprot:EPY15885.1 hypothetical protein STCU_11699 [Strigomonas culicis]